MSIPLAARLPRLFRLHNPLQRVPVRAFHSPFVVLSASNPLTTLPPTATSMYEKQDDTSSEPHLSSSGTRTYVVSEPDPSNTPFQVPSGAYPTSTPYVTTPYKEASIGESAAVRSTVTGEMGRTHGGTGAAHTNSGKL